jgi:intein/homing endonuclease
MSGWKKYFKTATFGSNSRGNISPLTNTSSISSNFGYRNYQSQLPEVYVGHPNRVDRYNQYEQMDADSDVNAALDIIAEFSVQLNEENGTVFNIHFNESPTDNEVKIIKEQLIQWCKLNELNQRMFKIFRSVIKYGDQVFIRDPETFKLYWTEMANVSKVIVNESDGKKPEQYVIKDINPNLESLTVTSVNTSDIYMNHPQIGGPQGSYSPMLNRGGGSRFNRAQNEGVINADNIIHISLTEGVDIFWPFGVSVLESVFKVFKQKELLEDSVILYRIQRAPERRIFKIDVGDMPSHMAMAFVERIKNEVQQRRIPTQSGGGCFSMDTEIPLLDGRVLTISQLAEEYQKGKENWAYSCNPETGKPALGLITWAGITQTSASVIELTLDNNEKIICTPEHKFPILNKGFVEAIRITKEDKLFGFEVSGSKNINLEKQYPLRTVISIKRLNDYIPVGTLTIDDKELFNNYHTFAIKQGVFTKNSNMLDASYNPMCLELNTKIPLFDGRVLTLKEIINEFENGKENWIYSCDPHTGKIVPGVIDWAGVTRKNTETIKLFFNNGKYLICTPDHKIPVMGKGFVEAQHVQLTDKLFTFDSNDNQIWDSSVHEWTNSFEIANVFFGNKIPNYFKDLTTSELIEMDTVPTRIIAIQKNENCDTGTITVDGKEIWHNHHTFAIDAGIFVKNSINEDYFFPQNSAGRGSSVEVLPGGCLAMDTLIPLLDGRILTLSELTNEYIAGKDNWTYSCNPITGKIVSGLISWAGVTQKSATVLKLTLSNGNTIICTPDHNFPIINVGKTEAIDTFNSTIIPFVKTEKEEIFDVALNKWVLPSKIIAKTIDENKDKIDLNELRKLLNLQISIFENEIKLLKPEKVFVTKIEMLPEKIEVGTLTIDSEEVFHNYHTFALNAGVFTFNSNLGEVTDLRLFTNKLFRGLRIPSSYLPTQTDETANVHADGKTGIAMIQEFRFNAYCKRLQTQIVDSFNREFKLFMRFRGINIDNSVFDLKFNEPQNFTKYRQIEVDTARIQTFTQLEQFPYLSKRFLMKRYLDLSEEEMQENEQLWAEENNEPSKVAPDSSNLRNVGVSAGGISSDMENAALPDMEGDMGGMDTGGEMGGPDMGGASAGGEMGAEPTM